MSRKDVIIVACLLNIALFMILFATASVWEETQNETIAAVEEPVEHVVIPESTPPAEIVTQKQAPIDEIDEVVQEYTKRRDVLVKQPVNIVPSTPILISKEIISEVMVKKGDVLSKIAQAHGVSVEDILSVNGLTSTKLKIGQILKIKKIITEKTTEPIPEIEKNTQNYYVAQGGDNPWKIARKCKIDYDDLLRLNNLNEEKAKNLKIGQKLRIK